MTTASKQEQLQRTLDGIGDAVPDVEGALLASRDGLAIASALRGADPNRVAAMAATVLALGTTVVDTCRIGQFEETVIQGEGGMFVVYDAGDLAVLAVLARRKANLGLIHLEARRAATDLSRLLSAYLDQPAPAVTSTPAPAVESQDSGPELPSAEPAPAAEAPTFTTPPVAVPA